jgi:hypothetical protein
MPVFGPRLAVGSEACNPANAPVRGASLAQPRTGATRPSGNLLGAKFAERPFHALR